MMTHKSVMDSVEGFEKEKEVQEVDLWVDFDKPKSTRMHDMILAGCLGAFLVFLFVGAVTFFLPHVPPKTIETIRFVEVPGPVQYVPGPTKYVIKTQIKRIYVHTQPTATTAAELNRFELLTKEGR